ncbi:carboxypeptidase O-like [Maniola jurtina]|uniref:carboxypeptidase O-like n=1 Tax=Maniola jurtina TaxID=191418 RepID=UPI001E685CA1|nr:carboxypeptidase O-like [Maniola jurtina]
MDWISSAVILNLLNDLLENVVELKLLIANFNFYFMPILNPDGFDYSKKQDRFWSKNRRKLDTETRCENKNEPIGVTIARNWFYQKILKRVGEECNSVYIGHRPISEEENQGLSYVLNNLALSIIAFINVRGFGRYIAVPYADVSAKTNNHNIVMEILKATSYKMRTKHNITFDIGPTSNYFYNFTGNMADWVKKKLNTPLVYTVYLEDIFNILPHPKNIKFISKQFYTILNESLLVTKDIYGPLFNDVIKTAINFLLFNTIFVSQLLLLCN